MSMTRISHLTTEYRDNPLGIDARPPRLAWQMETDRPGARQTAYRIVAASTAAALDTAPDRWDSGRIETDQSLYVAYGGAPLASRERVYWRVTVWDEDGQAAQSDTAWFEMGLLDPADWQARWIGSPFTGGPRSTLPAPCLRGTFHVAGAVRSARLYVTALGLFECTLNGQAVGEDVFAPGWTDYHKRVQVLTYDVTSLVQPGDNVLGAVLGDGWAVGYIGWMHRQNYVDRPQLLAQLEIVGVDGHRHTVVTDERWTFTFGPVTHSDFLMGEAFDARRLNPAWALPGAPDPDALPVRTFDHPGLRLVALNGPTVRRMETLAPVSEPVNRSDLGRRRFVFDLGQNMVGRVRFQGSAPAGTTIILRFAEVLNPDGSLYTTNLRSAHATDYYTFAGTGVEIWEPQFTFHGFRYVEIENYEGPVSRDTLTGIVLHSAMAPTGHFTCSDPLLNQLQHNIVWGQKGNFVDVPTDCPQRDERLGWTGDIQVFVRTAAFNMHVAAFMTKWARDVADAQNADGSIPAVVPMASNAPKDGGPAWADAVVICPWTVYQCYGDTRILAENWETMTRFMAFLIASSPGFIRCAPDYEGWPGFGDWLSINADTPRDLIGTAFLAYDADLMARMARVLGRDEEAAYYQQVFEHTRTAFFARFGAGSPISEVPVVPSKIRKLMDDADRISRGNLHVVDYGAVQSEVFNTRMFTPTQTAYVLALHFGLLPEPLRETAARELVADIERRGGHLSTGFVGSPYLNHVLSAHGQSEAAFRLLGQTSWPSWLYAVTQGATTIWERWDGWTPEHGFQTPDMNSFNHYAYGAIGDWLYQVVAGLNPDPAAPGYRHTIVRPQPGGGLVHAEGSLHTGYGLLVSRWALDDGRFTLHVQVPPNTTATVHLPTHLSLHGAISHNDQPVVGSVHTVAAGVHRFVMRA
jgi:alpha-L-rhamnosidase